MARTAADFMAEALQKAGVKRVYGVVGDSLNGFTDSLRRLKSIDWIHTRHEEAAAFAAGAEAHLTGELAVCAGSCGPGNLHLINGLYDCQRSRVPVLAIAAHIPSREIIENYVCEVHRLLRPGALFKFGVQGNPHTGSTPDDTWLGFAFSDDEATAMANRSGFEPRYRHGVGDQYFWLWYFKNP